MERGEAISSTPGNAVAPRPVSFLWPASFVLLVLYGSLIPFDLDPARLQSLFQNGLDQLRFRSTTPDDAAANVLIYLPMGLAFAAFLRSRGWTLFPALLAAAFGGAATSCAAECAQTLLRSRVPSLTDVLLNIVGCSVGALATPFATRFRRGMADQVGRELRESPSVVLAALLTVGLFLYHLFPFDWVTSTQALHASFSRAQWGSTGSRLIDGGPGAMTALAAQLGASLWFILLGYLSGVARNRPHRHPMSAFLSATGGGALLALLIELMQLFTRSHVFDAATLQLNAFGVAFGAWAGVFVFRPEPEDKRPAPTALQPPAPVLLILVLLQIGLLVVPYLARWSTSGWCLRRIRLAWVPLESLWQQSMSAAAGEALSMVVTYATLTVCLVLLLRGALPGSAAMVAAVVTIATALGTELLHALAGGQVLDNAPILLSALVSLMVLGFFNRAPWRPVTRVRLF